MFFRLSLPEHLYAAGFSLGRYDRSVLYHPYDQVLVSAVKGLRRDRAGLRGL